MSSSQLEWPWLSADGLPLTNSECLLLLESDDIYFDGDLLRNFPCGATKLESELGVVVELGGEGGEEGAGLLYPPSPPECKPSRAQLASDLLHQLDTQCKTESFPSWFEEKVELPIFEPHLPIPVPVRTNVSPVFSAAPPLQAPLGIGVGVGVGVKGDTAELLREFETVYGAVELTHLTPPQSPPGPATQLLLTYAQHAQAPAAAPAHALAWPPHPPPPPPNDIEREMAVVEELMRHSSAHLAAPPAPAPAPRSASPSPPCSPRSSSACSPSSSSSSSSSASCSADEEWEREGERERERPHRAKPYSRSTEDRRSRKKEQNKNAATRYRQKKKAEIEVLLCEEGALRARRGELDTKCADLQREIRYLKGLMRDLFKAKGLIK